MLQDNPPGPFLPWVFGEGRGGAERSLWSFALAAVRKRWGNGHADFL